MTTAAEHLERAILVVSDLSSRQGNRTQQVLSDLGHHVAAVHSPDEATELLQAGSVDLLVIDLAFADQKRRLIDQIAALPAERRPRRIALFAEEADEYARTLHREGSNPRVHVFLKPLHLHGLLNVLRSIERRNLATA